MSWRSRRALATIGAVALLGTLSLQFALAQPVELPIGRVPPVGKPGVPGKPLANDPSELYGITLPTDDGLKEKIKDINVFIQVQDWPNAVDRLQQILDREGDVFAPVMRVGADGRATQHMVSVKTEARRLIGDLPEPGREYYKITFGPQADVLLKSAKATGDIKALAEVMNRYLYTDSGAEAAELLATYQLNRGNYVQAAISFERLFQRTSPRKLDAITLFKAALAFHRAGGDNKFNLDNAWKHLEEKGGNLTLGTRVFSIDDLKAYVAGRQTIARIRERYDWAITFGDPSRSAQGDGGTAFLDARWKHELVSENQTKGWIKQVTEYLDGLKQPHLHAFSPIAVTATTQDGRKVPLMVYRSFWGIHARAVRDVPADEVKVGEIYWEAPSNWSIDKMARDPRHLGSLNQWLQTYINSRVRPQILFENSVVGSLSTDNTRVYAIDDFQVPPHNVQAGRIAVPVGGAGGAAMTQFYQHNRLQAYELDSGKLLWEIGSAGEKGDLVDSFFLSPPLPLNGKLYVLNEKDQELRLLCLDPTTGALVGKPQRLADLREKIQTEVSRRFNAAHLAYGEGILVCPTNSGGILGVDLLTNSLVWAYGYREKQVVADAPQPGQPGFVGVAPPGMIRLPDGRVVPAVQTPSNWRATPPVVTEGKVVFTAPDSGAVHCLNLRDGSRLWRNARKEGDLYLAGVFAGKALVVGRTYARAINLADGTEAWSLETGLPSGFGIASKDVYYLPLAEAARTREPVICLIDVSKGIIHATTRSRKKEIPGNLLFYEGEVLSQSLSHVAAYPQLDVELKRIDDLLAKDALDPEGLTRRGDLRLDKGDLGGAIEDLRVALSKMKDDTAAELRTKARGKLFESMTEFLQRDFNKAEKYLAEYEGLCKVTDPTLTPEQRRAEEKRRKGNLYCLVGRGKEQQKKLVEAFEAYMNFGTLGAADNEMMSVVDDPGVKTSPMVWAQGRISGMVATATRDERAPLEKLVEERWKKVRDGADLDTLRNFVTTFGSISEVGRTARLQLAERLIADNADRSFIEAERHLNLLRAQKDDTATAARSVEALARLMTRKGLMEDAAHYYRVLGRDFAKVEVKDGKTGQDYFNDLATDKRFLPYLDEPILIFSGKLRAQEFGESHAYQANTFQLEQVGEPLPFFTQNYKLAIRADYSQLKVIERETGQDWCSFNLTNVSFAPLAQHNMRNPSAQPRHSFQSMGHLVVVQVGYKVFAIDPVGKKLLWEKALTGSGMPQIRTLTVDPRDGSTQVIYADGWMQRLGQTGPLSPLAVGVVTTEGLQGLDPVTGDVLWVRNDVSKNSHLYTDNEHVYTIEVAADGTVGSTRVFRLHDGVTVPVKDFSDLYRNRIRMYGRTILTSDSDGRGVTLRLYDVLTGKDRWKGSFLPGSHVLQPESDDVAGVVEPNGKAIVVNVNTLKELKLKGIRIDPKTREVVATDEAVKPEHLQKVQTVRVIRDNKDVFILCEAPQDQNIMPNTMQSNLLPGMGLRAIAVNGEVYAFDGESGEVNWFNTVNDQMLLLDEFERIPVMLFTVRYRKWTDQFKTNAMYYAALRSYDKRTGRLLSDKEDPNTTKYQQFHTIKVDARAGRVDLLSANLRWSHSIDTGVAGPGDSGRAPGVPTLPVAEGRDVPPLPPVGPAAAAKPRVQPLPQVIRARPPIRVRVAPAIPAVPQAVPVPVPAPID